VLTAIGLVNGNPAFMTPTELTSLNLSLKNLVMIDAVVFIIIFYEHFNIWQENAYSRTQNWGFGQFDF